MNRVELEVKCQVYSINCFSAHADANGLVNFVESMNVYPSRIYLVHGERDALESLYRRLPKVRKWIPKSGDVHEVRGVRRVEPVGEGSKIVIEGEVGFVSAFGLDYSNDDFVLVREGDLIKVVRHDLFLERLRRIIEEYGMKIKALTVVESSRVEGKDLGDVVEWLREYREKGILSKGLAKSLCNLLLRGKDEAIRELNIKRVKKRFHVQDDDLINEFVDYMVKLINSSEESFVINCLCEVYPDLRRIIA